MPEIWQNIQLGCAACRIFIYVICRRFCCCVSLPPPARPEFNVIFLGLANSGKSTVLALLTGEKSDRLEPTIGFSIKAVQFSECILNVKEVGGGDKVRPFWKHYYTGVEGIVFILDSAAMTEDLDDVKIELSNVLVEPQLANYPCLILASSQDKEGAASAQEITNFLELEKLCDGRQWCVHPCTIKDLKTLKNGFEKFNKFLVDVTPQEVGVAENRV